MIVSAHLTRRTANGNTTASAAWNEGKVTIPSTLLKSSVVHSPARISFNASMCAGPMTPS